MKIRFSILLITICFSLNIWGQLGMPEPEWVTQTPISPKGSYFYYKVTMGEGVNLDEAYTDAFQKAVKEAYLKIGGRVTTQDGAKTIALEDFTMQVPINQVCKYYLQLYSPNRMRMYVLWQIANDALKYPTWEEYTKCND